MKGKNKTVQIEIPDSCTKCQFLRTEETMEVGLSPDEYYCGLFAGEYLGNKFDGPHKSRKCKGA